MDPQNLENQTEMEVENQGEIFDQQNWRNQLETEAENRAISKEPQHKQYFEENNFDGVETLRMQGEYVSDRSFQIFVENFHRFPQLKNICFGYNRIKDEGVKKLTEKSDCISELIMLDFTQNQIQFGMKYFCENSSPLLNLQILGFGENKVGDSGLIALAQNGEKYPKLITLSLKKSQLTDQGVIKFAQNVHKFPQLVNINMDSNQIADGGLRAILENIQKLSKLKSIELASNKFYGSGLRGIQAKVDTLMVITLSYNQIDDSGLKQLVQTGLFRNIVHISLEGNYITDAGVKTLLYNNNYLRLEELYMGQNRLSHMSFIYSIKNKEKLPMLTHFATDGYQRMWEQQDKWQNLMREKGIFPNLNYV